MYIQLTWHPWRANPLDYVGKRLVTRDGKCVELTRTVLDFVVTIDGKEISRTMDNGTTCYVLDMAEVGLEA